MTLVSASYAQMTSILKYNEEVKENIKCAKITLILNIISLLCLISSLITTIYIYSIKITNNNNLLNDINIIFVDDNFDDCNYQLINIDFNNNICIGNIYNTNKNISCEVNINYNSINDMVEYCFNKTNYQCYEYNPDVANGICFTSKTQLNNIQSGINNNKTFEIILLCVFGIFELIMSILWIVCVIFSYKSFKYEKSRLNIFNISITQQPPKYKQQPPSEYTFSD